ncbi:hypothetical protein EMCRGX_G025591 [Ephydatia muelleri]
MATTRDRIMSSSSRKNILQPDMANFVTTVVPFREGFRCYRLGFCFHDIRAFTTSWLPLPIFVVYRVLLFCYIFSWLVVHAVTHNFKWKFFIYLTNLTTLLINADLLLLTTLCVAYAVLYYCNRPMLVSRLLPEKPGRYSQDQIGWYVKVSWFLHNSATALAIMIALGYWSLVYQCPPSVAGTVSTPNASDPAPQQVSNASCADASTIHAHGIDALLLVLDIFLSRVPVQLYHFSYLCAFTFAYIVLTLIYWGAGGTNVQHQLYIYSVLDYTTKKTSTLFAVLLVFAPMVFFIIVYFLALVRDLVTSRLRWFFRDIYEHAEEARVEEVELGEDPNVQVTKVEVTVA